MTRFIRWLGRLWRTPSDFEGSPLEYALNQIGHGYLIGGVPALIWGPAALLPLVLVYLAVVELPQLVFWRGRVADGLEDAAHVATVAVAVAYGAWPALAAHALFVAAGTVARMNVGETDGNA
jgi:hypothetical protein